MLVVAQMQVMLAAAAAEVPASDALPGGCAYEIKLDGFRAVIADGPGRVTIASRQGRSLGPYFPEVVAAAAMLPAGTVVDGEIVRLGVGGRLDFAALQRRLLASSARAAAAARAAPASFAAFDLLRVEGVDVRREPYARRRERLEQLMAEARPPLQLTPMTTNRDEALRWFRDYPAAGVEGLDVKGLATPYQPGVKGWVKVRHRHVSEAAVIGVLGDPAVPTALVLARPDISGGLRLAGATQPLPPSLAAQIAELLEPVDVDPQRLPAGRLGVLGWNG